MSRKAYLLNHVYRPEIGWVENPTPLYSEGHVVHMDGVSWMYFHAIPSSTIYTDSTHWLRLTDKPDQGEPGVAEGLVTPPTITGPTNISVGRPYLFTAVGSNVIATSNGVITGYEWLLNDVITMGESYSVNIPDGSTGGPLTLKARAVSSTGDRSVWTTITIISIVNTAPVVTNFSTNIPNILQTGVPVNVAFSGVTDAEGDTLTYSIINPIGCNFDKLVGITTGVVLTPTAPALTASFDVVVTDSMGDSAVCGHVTVPINYPPVIGGVVNNLPALLSPGVAYPFAFTGATDPNGGTLTYVITGVTNGSVTPLSNTTGSFSITPGSSGTSCGFTLTLTDATGVSSSAKSFTKPVNLGPVGDTIVSSLVAQYSPSQVAYIAFTGATDPNGDTLTYEVSNVVGATLSKTTGIANNEQVTLTVGTTGVVVSFDVKAKDTSGVYSVAKSFSAILNQPPVATGITSTLPVKVNNSTDTQISFTGATDPNVGDPLTYEIIDPVNCSFSKTTGIVGGESITFTSGNSGVTATFSVKAKDTSGAYSGEKAFSTVVNLPPISTVVAVNYPGIMIRGVSYPLVLTGATDANGGALTYEITSTTGGEVVAVDSAGNFTLAIGATATSVSLSVRVKDSDGIYSSVKTLAFSGTLSSPTADITVPAGTSQTVTIPAGIAGTVTVDGNGGGGILTPGVWGTERLWNDGGVGDVALFPSSATPLTVNWDTPAMISVNDQYGQPRTLVRGIPSTYWIPFYTLPGFHGSFYFNGPHTEKNANGDHYDSVATGNPGLPSTLSGAIAKTFSGAASGVTTAPASTQQLFSLNPATTHTVTVSAAANGGSVRIRY